MPRVREVSQFLFLYFLRATNMQGGSKVIQDLLAKQ